MPTVTAIVVSYNTKPQLRACLDSLGEADQVIVVDNASGDGSPEMVAELFPSVTLIANNLNKGFGTAVNQGLSEMESDLALVLNADIRAQPGAIPALATAFDSPTVVAAGGKLVFPDGTVQQSTANPLTLWAVFCEQTGLEKLFPDSRLLSPYWTTNRILTENSGAEIIEVGQVMGACLMMKPVERFDESFFLYCEDTELCHRLTKHGRIVYVPGAEFIHELGAASTGSRWRSIALYNSGKDRYFRIHHGKLAALACANLNTIGALMRIWLYGLATLVTLGLVPRFRKQLATFSRVLVAPLSGPTLPADSSPPR